MKLKKINLAVLAVVLCSGASWAQTQPASRPYELDDRGLTAAIAGLDDPSQRYESFKKLVLYFWSYPHGSPSIVMSYGSAELNARVKRAGQEMSKAARDVALVKQSMADTNRTMQWWAIGEADAIISDSRGKNPWKADTDPVVQELLAKVREFLSSKDAGLRQRAENALRNISSEWGLLQTVLAKETSPENIMFMVSGQISMVSGKRDPAEYSRLMNGHLMRLLGMNDQTVRADALAFIDRNSSSAETYHCDFNKAVADKVLELARNQIDRAATAGALAALYLKKAGDPERFLATLQEMSTDNAPTVRQRVVLALVGRRDSKELDSIFKGMAKDTDDYVRLIMLMDAGYEGHEDELRQFAQSPNPEVARQAADILRLLQERAAATRKGQ